MHILIIPRQTVGRKRFGAPAGSVRDTRHASRRRSRSETQRSWPRCRKPGTGCRMRQWPSRWPPWTMRCCPGWTRPRSRARACGFGRAGRGCSGWSSRRDGCRIRCSDDGSGVQASRSSLRPGFIYAATPLWAGLNHVAVLGETSQGCGWYPPLGRCRCRLLLTGSSRCR